MGHGIIPLGIKAHRHLGPGVGLPRDKPDPHQFTGSGGTGPGCRSEVTTASTAKPAC